MPDWRRDVWRQFGAAIDMLENAITACPDTLWGDRSRRPEFWYLAFHTLFFLDLYLSSSDKGWAPPPPFTLGELDPAGVLPERPYTRDELLRYLEHGREKCRAAIAAITDGEAAAPRSFGRREASGFEWLLYNLRHVQHHAAQLNLILRQATDSAPGWVRRAKDGLPSP
ncbi:MAG TPA: DinB family protein [Longimicrobiaceae bacterium]